VASHVPRSALIVEVPAAEPVVARHRERLDSSAPLGIPAHVTVLYPFMRPDAIGPPVLAGLPIDAEATAVTLMTQEAAGAHWVRTAAFPLAEDPAPAADPVPAGDPVPEA
jgi:hypothetical protein